MSAIAQNDTRQTADFCVSIDMIFANFYSSLWPWKIKVALRNSTFQWNFSIPQLIHRLRREGSVLILQLNATSWTDHRCLLVLPFCLSYGWVKVIILHTFPINKYIHRINFYPLDSAIVFPHTYIIHWIVISPVDCAIHLLNYWGQNMISPIRLKKTIHGRNS